MRNGAGHKLCAVLVVALLDDTPALRDSVDMLWVLLYRIVDGRIAEVDNFAGDQHAVDAFFTKVWQPRLRPVQERFAPGEPT